MGEVMIKHVSRETLNHPVATKGFGYGEIRDRRRAARKRAMRLRKLRGRR